MTDTTEKPTVSDLLRSIAKDIKDWGIYRPQINQLWDKDKKIGRCCILVNPTMSKYNWFTQQTKELEKYLDTKITSIVKFSDHMPQQIVLDCLEMWAKQWDAEHTSSTNATPPATSSYLAGPSPLTDDQLGEVAE